MRSAIEKFLDSTIIVGAGVIGSVTVIPPYTGTAVRLRIIHDRGTFQGGGAPM